MSNDFNTTRGAQQKRGRPMTHRFCKSKYFLHPEAYPASSPLPPPIPASLPPPSPPLPPLPSSLLPPLPDSLFIPPADRRESSTAIPRPIGGRRVDYGFVGTLDAEARRQRAEVVGYGIRDTWVDPRGTTEEVAPVTLEGVNTRVTELAAVQEQDTQDIYAVIEDTQDRQTQIHQTVEALVDDRQYHYETARLLDQEALVSREAWAHSMGFSSAVHYELQGYRTHVWTQDHRMDVQDSLIAALTAQVSSLQGHLATALGEIRALQAREQARADVPEGTASTVVGPNNMPPRRSSATARAVVTAAARAAAATTPMTAAAGTEGVVVLAQWFEKMESVFHISNCAVENQVKFATCTFIGNALTWWNSHMKAVTQDVAYAMDWKTLKKMMTVKYCPRGEIKKLEIKLWNLKVKGIDITSYTLRFQELALMCGRMFPEESDEVEKYVGGLPDMIRGNVMSYRPQIMEEAIEFANDQMDQKLITITERQAEQKRKLEYNAGNNQGHQQQNKRQNTGRAYTAGPGEKREYTGSLPLCTKCNYHHKGPCAPRCNKCKKIGHLARDCRSSGPNGALQERLPEVEEWKPWNGLYVTIVCYVLLAIVVDRGTRSVPLFVVLEPVTVLKGIGGIVLSVTVSLFVDCCSERDVSLFSLIPLSRRSFDVIVGMDWLSKRKFVIVCNEKVIRILLEGDETLQVHGERTQGIVKSLMNTKFLGARHSRKSHSRLAPLEMQELSDNFKSMSMAVHLKLAVEYYRGREKCNAKYTKE
ncbi:putative reverse transcriptase domain-containing protein [Tanacetum coccineum]